MLDHRNNDFWTSTSSEETLQCIIYRSHPLPMADIGFQHNTWRRCGNDCTCCFMQPKLEVHFIQWSAHTSCMDVFQDSNLFIFNRLCTLSTKRLRSPGGVCWEPWVISRVSGHELQFHGRKSCEAGCGASHRSHFSRWPHLLGQFGQRHLTNLLKTLKWSFFFLVLLHSTP